MERAAQALALVSPLTPDEAATLELVLRILADYHKKGPVRLAVSLAVSKEAFDERHTKIL